MAKVNGRNDHGGHKPGPLKQQNKAHKHGRHRTKSQIENQGKGKELNRTNVQFQIFVSSKAYLN